MPEVETMNDGVAIINGCRDLNKNGSIEPYEDWRQPLDVRINDLMSRMTDEEKAYQMFYNAQIFPISGWHFGPAMPSDLYNYQVTTAQTRLGIPFVSLGDCIHGYKTSYPTQIGMAASRNLDLTYQCGRVQQMEQTAVGFRGTLAPLAEVGTKVLYPRIQEGGGEDAEFAAALTRALVAGLQAGPELNPNSVLVTTKHWPGEGAGGEGGIVFDGISIKYHMKPWFANMDAGAGSIMPGYAGSSFLDPGGPGAGDSKPILDYLRDTVNFQGIICTDWLPWGNWAAAAKAGSDVMGGADPGATGFTMSGFINEVGMARINDAVRKVLDVKFRLGIFEDPYGDPVNGPNAFHTQQSLDIVTQAARESITMIKNDGTAPLNLPAGANLLVTGSRADDGESHTVWTTAFHWEYGTRNILQALQDKGSSRGINVYHDNAPNPAAAVVVVGEGSYTHATAWEKTKPYVHDTYFRNELEADSTRLNQVRAMGIPYIVVVISPRPYVLTQLVNDANAVFLAYRPGDGGGPAVADVLFGDYAPKGKLPWQLPRSMAQIGGDQLSTANERWDIPFDLGATSAERQEIRSKIAAGELLQPIYGDPLFQYGFGLTYGGGLARTADDNAVPDELSTRDDNVKMFPNPVTNRLNVVTDSEGPVIYRVVSPSGRIVRKGESKFATFTLDTQGLPGGVYILQMDVPGKRPVTKLFIKE
ncbi:MAG: glycoside hydrolase family 3 N-terminal domain-containing protein [Cyclobacteriaceae bacterium]